MNNNKKEKSRIRHAFLKDAFFKNDRGFAIYKGVPGWVLTHNVHPTGAITINIYTEESFEKSQEFYRQGLLIGGTP